MNTYKQPSAESQKEIRRRQPVNSRFSLNLFGFITRYQMVKALQFVFFLTVLGLVYIANSYYAEKKIRQIDSTVKELKELRAEQISVKSEYMLLSKQTHVVSKVSVIGLKESTSPPKKIVVKNQPKAANSR